jgi:hypothetical protein
MTISRNDEVIRLEGRCRLQEAETLLELVLANPGLHVDLSECTGMHAAVAQILIGSRAQVLGKPANPFLAERLLPHLNAAAPASAGEASSL